MSQGRIHFERPRATEIWTWRVVSSGSVIIKDPKRKKYVIPMTEVTGCTWDQIERAHWKGNTNCDVTPRKVKNYIERELTKK
jgi:hypothetical protein